MLYILDHRLKAQNVPHDKCCKGMIAIIDAVLVRNVFRNSFCFSVIADVSRALFARRFLKELFRPQEAYNMRQVRAVSFLYLQIVRTILLHVYVSRSRFSIRLPTLQLFGLMLFQWASCLIS